MRGYEREYADGDHTWNQRRHNFGSYRIFLCSGRVFRNLSGAESRKIKPYRGSSKKLKKIIKKFSKIP